ncbi:Pectinesterase [Heracleum sosnowskyi]|uniref:Pectinesterase n=1 Tax=Heracleum sosnowskyi TaxID=360622 RepID=A0AAD8NBE4_9APIA|nr:Pectinesterase [Heracleum sosnowskyi]
MKTEMVLLSVSISILLLLPSVYSSPFFGNMIWWCNQTPYPDQCKYHMNRIPELTSSISRQQFLTEAEETALQEVNSALQFIKSLEPKVVSKAERSAWNTCLVFFDLTAYRLNKTLDTTTASTPDDIQTWLSAAATNIRSCNDGFFDLNVTNNIYPLVIANNVTQLISNCLAVNYVITQDKEDIIHEAFSKNISRKDVSLSLRADCVVAQDGSGNYRTISEALAASAHRTGLYFVIHVKQGIYNEIVIVTQKNILLVGDGVGKTVITGNRRVEDGFSLQDCATFKVTGDGFKAFLITFENAAGDIGRAVAMASSSDLSVFYHCTFKGYQDTLYVTSNRQFYKKCQIFGTVDFIFGNAAAVFQDCTIYARKPKPGGGLVVTAQSREHPYENTGITIHRCGLMRAPELKPFPQYKAFLGRPWKEFARTAYLRSSISDLVDPAGWMTWEGAPPSRSRTVDYGEFENTGPGASTNRRVKWRGYHVIRDLQTAAAYDVTNLINGKLWLPATGVPFDANV